MNCKESESLSEVRDRHLPGNTEESKENLSGWLKTIEVPTKHLSNTRLRVQFSQYTNPLTHSVTVYYYSVVRLTLTLS